MKHSKSSSFVAEDGLPCLFVVADDKSGKESVLGLVELTLFVRRER